MKYETVGRVLEIWRYPVKSMRGESLQVADIDSLGLNGDRGWAVKDNNSGEIKGAKRFPDLMQCSAKYLSEPTASMVPPADILFPDGSTIRTDLEGVSRKISDYLKTEVTLFPRLSEANEEHYKRKEELSEDMIRQMLGLGKDEPLPDLSVFPADKLEEINEFATPKGTYFDAYPIHLLTTSWLRELSKHSPDSSFERDRFRPNIVVETDISGLAELNWCGKNLHIGDTEFACEIPTIRCSMTTHSTGTLPRDINVLRTIAKKTGRNVGVYANVSEKGKISVGDDVKVSIS